MPPKKDVKLYSVQDILDMDPCQPEYTRERVEELFAGKEGISVFDVAEMPISNSDKGWALGRMMPWPDGFVLPEGVTRLRIENNPGLTSVDIPEGVTRLRIENNPGLTSVDIPEGVTDLRIMNNPGLTSVDIPEGVTDLWIVNNPGLTSVDIPEGVTDLRIVDNPGLKGCGE